MQQDEQQVGEILNEIKEHVKSREEEKWADCESLQQTFFKSWMTSFACSLRSSGIKAEQNFLAFQGYEPCSFYYSRHACDIPLKIKDHKAFAKSFHYVKKADKFIDYLAICKKAQAKYCCDSVKNMFVRDTAYRQRRYCTKVVVYTILNQLVQENETLKVRDMQKWSSKEPEYCGNAVERFENNYYTLPRGYQCCICTHDDTFCLENQQLLTVRAQQNAFQCQVHFDYGTKQARQLAHRGMRENQRFSYYVITDGYYFSFIKIDWLTSFESRTTFNAAIELDALVEYGVGLIRQQLIDLKSKQRLENQYLPKGVELLWTKSDKVAIVSYKTEKFALKFQSSSIDQKVISCLKSFSSQCDRIVKQHFFAGDYYSMSISLFSGQSIFQTCLCDKETAKLIADVVANDIKRGLLYLHENGYVFVDVHPGNIVYSKESGAKLVDIESISRIGSDGYSIPIIQYFKGPDFWPDSLRACDDLISLRLVGFWILNTLRFRDMFNVESWSYRHQIDLKISLLQGKQEI